MESLTGQQLANEIVSLFAEAAGSYYITSVAQVKELLELRTGKRVARETLSKTMKKLGIYRDKYADVYVFTEFEIQQSDIWESIRDDILKYVVGYTVIDNVAHIHTEGGTSEALATSINALHNHWLIKSQATKADESTDGIVSVLNSFEYVVITFNSFESAARFEAKIDVIFKGLYQRAKTLAKLYDFEIKDGLVIDDKYAKQMSATERHIADLWNQAQKLKDMKGD